VPTRESVKGEGFLLLSECGGRVGVRQTRIREREREGRDEKRRQVQAVVIRLAIGIKIL
jgi:hypothetical protein